MARTRKRYNPEVQEESSVIIYRTGIYVRLSKERTESWRNKSHSLDTQESLAKGFAEEHGLKVVKCYIDYEYSGTNFERPAFQEMLKDIKNGVINCILIRDLSRLGRDYIEMGRLIDKVFPFLGVRFISINDNLDTVKGLEEKKSFEVEIKNLVNDLYSKDISKKVTAYNIQQANKGYFIGTSAPYGYKIDRVEDGSRLIFDNAVKPILDLVFQLLLEGQSIYQVTNFLNNQGIATPKTYRDTGNIYRFSDDKKIWHAGNLLRLIKSPAYRGELLQRTRNKKLVESEYIHTKNAHQGYISHEDYEKITYSLSNKKCINRSNRKRTLNRYKGLIYASGKNTQMRRYCKHFKKQDYYTFMDYIFDSQNEKRQTVYISESFLDKIVFELIRGELLRLGSINELISKLDEKKCHCVTIHQRQVEKKKKAIIQLRSEISELYASYSLLRDNKSHYLAKKVETEIKIETLSKEIVARKMAIEQIEIVFQKQVSWIETMAKCRNLSMLTVEFLNAVIDRIEIGVDKTVDITFTCQIGGEQLD